MCNKIIKHQTLSKWDGIIRKAMILVVYFNKCFPVTILHYASTIHPSIHPRETTWFGLSAWASHERYLEMRDGVLHPIITKWTISDEYMPWHWWWCAREPIAAPVSHLFAYWICLRRSQPDCFQEISTPKNSCRGRVNLNRRRTSVLLSWSMQCIASRSLYSVCAFVECWCAVFAVIFF